ncbi:hypothetical protein [Nannocystis sp.]|uniref:hypothetical protein n=1 Tax=Nannocystis sp. TaxID=1962667 RepID=UPI0025F73E8C|nr:hypothetical protein [Nannocystis sp.]MBK7826770.1 hypothetical protein [Nannocystis sp.]
MRALSLFGLILGLGLGCRSDAPVRDPAAASACGQRPDYENNCVACTSQPICGWCEHPQDGQPNCQASATAGATCRDGLRASTAECAAPLAVPPGAVE